MDLQIFYPFIWVFLRSTGLFMFAPVLGSKNISWPFRIGIALLASYFVMPSLPEIQIPKTPTGLVATTISELAVGLLLGFLGQVIMAAIETAGYLIDIQMGLSMANVVDPQLGQSASLTGILSSSIITLIFLILDGHHLFIKALWATFRLLPPGGAYFPTRWTEIGVAAAGDMLCHALLLACPVWAASLILDIALGVMARSVPQINVLMMGMPLKMVLGLAILSLSLTFYGIFMEGMLKSMGTLFRGVLGVVTK